MSAVWVSGSHILGWEKWWGEEYELGMAPIELRNSFSNLYCSLYSYLYNFFFFQLLLLWHTICGVALLFLCYSICEVDAQTLRSQRGGFVVDDLLCH
ncbi:hypothetical protein Sjap_006128 [Stephania japonica]|uniref:Uncharacterized protein n=1 Tax=Stephania japonica TaxID=461633 RepID=A0AAP0K6G2_9MAGN